LKDFKEPIDADDYEEPNFYKENIVWLDLNYSLFENVYEIAYKIDNLGYNKKRVKNLLSMLKHVFNFY
jgi:hypothetical protein